jgi:hypothetical protein
LKGLEQIGRRISGVQKAGLVSGVRSGQLSRSELAVGLAVTVGLNRCIEVSNELIKPFWIVDDPNEITYLVPSLY